MYDWYFCQINMSACLSVIAVSCRPTSFCVTRFPIKSCSSRLLASSSARSASLEYFQTVVVMQNIYNHSDVLINFITSIKFKYNVLLYSSSYQNTLWFVKLRLVKNWARVITFLKTMAFGVTSKLLEVFQFEKINFLNNIPLSLNFEACSDRQHLANQYRIQYRGPVASGYGTQWVIMICSTSLIFRGSSTNINALNFVQ